MFTGILLRFLLLETFMLGALCRVCFNKHPQKLFCISDFVVEVNFHEAKDLPGLGMDIIKVFKGNIEELSLRDNQYLNKDVVKHFNFKAGKKYYIFGRNVHGRIYFKMCNGVLPRENTTPAQRRSLVIYYESGCECLDQIGNYVKRCQWLFSLMYKFGNHCKWVESDSLKRCQKRESISLK